MYSDKPSVMKHVKILKSEMPFVSTKLETSNLDCSELSSSASRRPFYE